MRKVIFLFLLSMFVFQNNSKAQVTITYAADSTGGVCIDSSSMIAFYVDVEVLGYTNTDYPTYYVNFGDGTDTTWVDSSFFWNYPYAGFVISHYYTYNGIYDVTYIITMPDMQSDTLIVLGEVQLGTCPSISGQVYTDINNNCIFDTGDIPAQWISIEVLDSTTGNYIGWANTDANGYYSVYIPDTISAAISINTFGTAINNFNCALNDTIYTSSPASGIDFAISKQVIILDGLDSLDQYCFSGPTQADFGVFALTFGYQPSDIPTINIDFGDGTNATYSITNFSDNYPYIYFNTSYIYTTPGVYDVTYVLTMPDLVSDTLISYCELTINSCDFISGYVYNDQNSNCLLESTDLPIQVYLNAFDNNTGFFVGSCVTDANGYYELYLPTGMNVNLMLSTSLPNANFICPTTNSINSSVPSSNNNFALSGNYFDLGIFYTMGFFHPGFTETVQFNILDFEGLFTPNSQLSVVVNHPDINFISGVAAGGDNIPDVSGDTLTWDIPSAFINSSLFYTTPSLSIDFYTNPSAPIGSFICLDVIVNPIADDIDSSNNIQNICIPVANAYDPNFIDVNPHGLTSAGLIEANLEMTYTIHFQNTGNYFATNIVIKDTIDGNILDLTTFEILASSHTLTNVIHDGNGSMAFVFNNIYLPDSTSDEPNSHGWIQYKIDQKPNLIPSTTIENTAYIYFDFNPPIVTNTALNTISDELILEEKSIPDLLTIYPIPASDFIIIRNANLIQENYQIIDVDGKIVQTGLVSDGQSISISSLSNGIYFFKLENGLYQKIIVQK